VFTGNSDSVTPVTHMFQQPISARYVRINPVTWEGRIALRFELHGCFEPYPTDSPPEPDNHVTSSIKVVTGVSRVTVTPVPINIPDGCVTWDEWVDTAQPDLTHPDDVETPEHVQTASKVCKDPLTIQCRTAGPDRSPADESGQKVRCTLWEGLVCKGAEQQDGMCLNYEVRLGCLRQTEHCLSAVPTATPTPEPTPGAATPCYVGMDTSSCPAFCPTGTFCDGSKCVTRSACPCHVDGKIIKAGDVTQNNKCETCQCLNGGLMCLSKTCPDCAAGPAVVNSSTCDCQCMECGDAEFQCGNGQCIPISQHCDGVIHCVDDELNCGFTPHFTPPVTSTSTFTSTTKGQTTVIVSPGGRIPTAEPHTGPPLPGSTTQGHTTAKVSPGGKIPTAEPHTGPPLPGSTTRGHTTVYASPGGRIPTAEPHTGPPLPGSTSTRSSVTSTHPVSHFVTTSTPPVYVSCDNVTCPPLVEPSLGPGYQSVRVRSEGGCCDEYLAVCQPSLCPRADVTCTSPRVATPTADDQCCPSYECEKVGRPLMVGYRVKSVVMTIIPRHVAVCPAECPEQIPPTCASGSQPVEIREECGCTRKACRQRNGRSPEVLCETQMCAACKTGEELVEREGECCGECRPIGCVVDDVVYSEGQIIPSDRKCYEKTCAMDKSRGAYVIQETHRECEPFSELPACTEVRDKEEPDYQSDGCCLACVPKSLLPPPVTSASCTTCSPQVMFPHAQDSVGYFTDTNPTGAECSNQVPVADMTECSGFCDSRATYTDVMRSFSDTCSCCRPTATSARTVQLTCSDGSTMTHTYHVANACACGACTGH
ncbi:hypothetical protein BaRGS_00024787, partial [Batillaria attramentaria]